MVCASAPPGRMLGRSARSRQWGQARHCGVQVPRCGRQVPRCSVQIAACSLQRAPCSLQMATCRLAGRASRPADRAVQPDKTGRWPLQRRQRAGWASFCSLQVARCSLQAAACRPAGRPCRSAGSRLHTHTAGSARPQGGLCITARRWFGLAGRFPSRVGRRVHGLDQARAGAVAANHQRVQSRPNRAATPMRNGKSMVSCHRLQGRLSRRAGGLPVQAAGILGARSAATRYAMANSSPGLPAPISGQCLSSTLFTPCAVPLAWGQPG